jgi:hypothetical protein
MLAMRLVSCRGAQNESSMRTCVNGTARSLINAGSASAGALKTERTARESNTGGNEMICIAFARDNAT